MLQLKIEQATPNRRGNHFTLKSDTIIVTMYKPLGQQDSNYDILYMYWARQGQKKEKNVEATE